MKKICFINSGCGIHDDSFRQLAECVKGKFQLTNFPHEADVIVQYLCCFTDNEIAGYYKKLSYLSHIKKEGAILIITGCGANVTLDEFWKGVSFVDYVVKYENMVEEITQILDTRFTNELYMEDNPKRLILNITNGCYKPSGICTFCKLHYLKIGVKSKGQIDEIVETVRKYELPILVLTGLNVGNYGMDFSDGKPKLHLLLRKLSEIPTLRWIEIDNIPTESMYEELISEIETNEKVFLVQFFVQNWSDRMLKIMNTGATVQKNKSILSRLRNKAIISGLVISHPGETMEDVEENIKAIREMNLWYLRVFKCIPSMNTATYKMKQLEDDISKKHYDMVFNVVAELKHKYLQSLIGKKLSGFVLNIKTDGGKKWTIIQPLQFEGKFATEQTDFSLNPGDKVEVEIENIMDYDARYFKVKILEGCSK